MRMRLAARSPRLNSRAGRLGGGTQPPAHPGRRLAAVGILVFFLGICGAAAWYWLETRQPEPTMDDLLPGYSRANSRQMGVFYGKLGVQMWEWREALTRPGTQAVLIGLVASLVALACLRVAWLRGHDARHS